MEWRCCIVGGRGAKSSNARPTTSPLSAQVCGSHVPSMSGRDAAQLAWGVARLRYRPPEAWVRRVGARGAALAAEGALKPQVREGAKEGFTRT